MREFLKFGLLFVITSVLLTLITGYLSNIFNLMGASLNYVTTGSVGSVLSAIVGYVGWFLDLLFLNESISYTTYYGAIEVGSISWALTFARVVFGVTVMIIILKLIIDRG